MTNRVIEFYFDNIIEYAKLSTDTDLFNFIKIKCAIEMEGGYNIVSSDFHIDCVKDWYIDQRILTGSYFFFISDRVSINDNEIFREPFDNANETINDYIDMVGSSSWQWKCWTCKFEVVDVYSNITYELHFFDSTTTSEKYLTVFCKQNIVGMSYEYKSLKTFKMSDDLKLMTSVGSQLRNSNICKSCFDSCLPLFKAIDHKSANGVYKQLFDKIDELKMTGNIAYYGN